MWKPLVVLAMVAITALITPSEGTDLGPYRENTWHGNQYDCAKNETLDQCYSDCPPRFCGVNIAAVSCLAIEDCDCEPGCRCRDGYSRNAEGNCIREKDCPKCPNQNEVYDVCPALCPPQRCDVDDRVYDCMPPPRPGDPECEPGCRCADRHARNDDGICIPKDQCPQEQCRENANEEYQQCLNPCPLHRCDVDPRVIKCAAPPEPGDPECQPGCECFDGYARNDDGICIPRDQCPQEQCKGPNEMYNSCPNPCPPKRCDVDPRVIRCAAPPEPGDPECQPGCECFDGYARNDDGICIPRDQCPQDQCREQNEEYHQCLNPCPLHRCDVNPSVIFCVGPPEPGDPECQPGCECFDGYARNDDGICIPRDQCPQEQCNGPNEMYNQCPNPCPPKRCDVDPRGIRCAAPPEPGDPECQPGCECFDGYARNDIGICIPRDQCAQYCKGKHEIYSKCPALVCRPLNWMQVGFPQPCPHPAPHPSKCPGKPGCKCKSGYARNGRGKCIPIKKCRCGGDPNAVLGSGNCGRHCSDRNKKKPAGCSKKCKDKSSCKCRKGFWYDDNTGKCVLPYDCTPTCGKDEVYSTCTNSECRPKNCSQLGFSIPCPRIDPKNCIKGCLCKEDFARATNGTCIPTKKCPSCGGDPRAVSGCGNCRERCSDYYSSEPMICTKICNINGCECKKGLVLDESTGKCISPKKCVSCAGDYNSKPGCDKDCTKRCPGPKPAQCKCYKDGCTCKDGFVYDPKPKKCVRPEQCTPPCGSNEVLSNCSNGGCGPWRCTDVGFPTGCVKMDQKYCTVGCVCQEGYVKDENERCILIAECPEVCKENEVYSECTNGGCDARNCSQLGQPVPCVKLDPESCIKGCVCEEGYLFARNGTCVPEDQCDNCNKPHEYYDSCAPSCPPQTCESIGRQYKCPVTAAVCRGACRCDPGYFRNKRGECIRKQDCLKCTGPNEYWSCGGACDNVCKTLNEQNQTNCPIINIKCNEMCYCEEGYARNNSNICIPIENCPAPTCRKDEVFSECINGGCQAKNCSQLGKPVPCVKIDPKFCIKGCLCKEGYLRDLYGICVPKDKCGTCTGQDEVYDPCPPRCPPQTCESFNKTYNCPLMKIDEKNCKPACRCKKGFFRNKPGECISKANCLKCTGPNEYWSCGGACDNVCKTLNEQNRTNCPIINIKCNEMCYCDEGYARNNSNICIPIDNCPAPTCGKNEMYDSCANGGCQKRNCSQVGQPTLCIDPIECIGGCVCKEGYLRDEAGCGCCVPENECPPLKCTKRHEVYDPCPRTCPPQTCNAIGVAYPCPNPPEGEEFCQPACRCEDGYYRNSADECISEANCLQCTKPNEHFSCGPECDNVCATLSTQNRTNCPILNKRCVEKCYCDDNYARDTNDMCIPIDQCNETSCKGDPNAVPGCGNYCTRCSNYKREVACILSCELDGCDCKPGYIYDDNLEKCVLPKDCTPVCQENEVYNTCINGGCQKKKCSDLGRPDVCVRPRECRDGCLCKKGFLRAGNGTCVPINKCPKPVCPKHEVFDTCANGGCGRLKCSELTGPVICRDVIECIGDCVCVEGRLRNEDGVCVPESQCNPKCPRPHEVYNPCPVTCPPQTCESLDKAYVCPIVSGQEPPCEPGCICEGGFFKNKLGECISEANCLKCMGQYEFFSCGVECDNVCETLNEQSKDDCPYVNIQCNERCYCEDGYARNKSNTCIPIKDCPPSRCGPDERWEESPCQVCEPLTCAEVDVEMDCPPEEDNDCEDTPGCICKYGLVRNEDDDCVPISECCK